MQVRHRVIRLDKSVHERTNPDYVDKHLAMLAEDVKKCPDEWLSTMLAGLPKADLNALMEMGVIEKI